MSKLLKNSVIYTFVLVLQNATSFFLLPLYTSYLTPEDYGIVAVVNSIIGILTIFFTLSLNGAANRFYFAYKDNLEKLKRFWGSLFVATILNSIILGSLFYLFRSVLLQPFAGQVQFSPYILLGLISVTLNPAFLFFQSCIQATQNGKQFAVQNFLFFLLNLLLTIIFVTQCDYGAMGVLLARAITTIIFFILTLILFLPKIKIGINRDDLKTGFKYSLPLLPHSLFGWTYSTIDRLLINKIRTTAEVGLYNIGAQFGLVMNILTDSVNKAYAPWFFEKLLEGSSGKKSIVKVSAILVLAYSFIALCLSLFSPELVMLMTKSGFHSAWFTIPFISFSSVFGGIYYVVCNSLFVKKTYLVPFVTFSSAIFSIILNLLLIPRFGMIGAAISGLSAQFITSIVVLVVSVKVEPIAYNWRAMYFSAFLCFLSSFVAYILRPFYLFGVLIKLTVLIAVFTVLLVFAQEERRYLVAFFRAFTENNKLKPRKPR